jgi:hypothetical protein
VGFAENIFFGGPALLNRAPSRLINQADGMPNRFRSGPDYISRAKAGFANRVAASDKADCITLHAAHLHFAAKQQYGKANQNISICGIASAIIWHSGR